MHGTRLFSGKMLIDGKLVESIDGKWLDSINPADETELGRVPLGSARDMDMAVEAAVRAFPACPGRSFRGEQITSISSGLISDSRMMTPIWRCDACDQANMFGPAAYVSADDGEVLEFCQESFQQVSDQNTIAEQGGRDWSESNHVITENVLRGMYAYWRKIMEI